MSIEKYRIDSFKKEKLPWEFTMIPNAVLQNFTNEALCIWVHLSSLPENWKVNREYLMNKFDIGRDKLNRLLQILKKNYLIKFEPIRLSNGTIKVVQIIVLNGMEYCKKILNNQSLENSHQEEHQTTILKTQLVDNPVTGETAPINNIINIKENNKSKRERRRLSLSDYEMKDFEFNEKEVSLCKMAKTEPFMIFEKFKIHQRKKNKDYFHREDLELWIVREIEYSIKKGSRI